MNKVILVGNLTRDPEFSQTSSGVSVCKFNIAVNRRFTGAKGEREADFINIVTWRGLADTCGKYLHKGMKVGVSGSLQITSYDDRNGDKRYRTDIQADDVEFLSGGEKANEAQSGTAHTYTKKDKQDLAPVNDEGLPF